MNRILLIIVAVWTLTGCSKENSDVFVPYNNHPLNDTAWSSALTADAPANQITHLLSPSPVVDVFNPSITTTLRFSDKLEVTIPAGTCMMPDGSPVSGTVELRISEMNKKGDFIRFGKTTTSLGKLLEFDGSAFYIKAFKDNNEVVLRRGQNIIINLKDGNPSNTLGLFYGLENWQQPAPAGTGPQFTWIKSEDSSYVTTWTRQDSTGITHGYTIFSKKLNWLNCARYVDSTLPAVSVTATFPFNFTNKNTTVYAVSRQRKMVVEMNPNFANRSFFTPDIPSNTDLQLVSISLIGNQLYLATQDVTTAKDVVTIMKPVPATKEQVDQLLDNL